MRGIRALLSVAAIASLCSAGRTQDQWWKFDDPAGFIGAGASVTVLPDLTKDGVPEVGITSRSEYPMLAGVWILSGADRSMLTELTGFSAPVLTGLGDFDGDGDYDVLVCDNTIVSVYDALTGELIQGIFFGPPELSIQRATLLGDLDGDGIEEVALVFRSPWAALLKSELRVVSLGRLQDLWKIELYGDLGYALVSIQDLDRDGVQDLILGTPELDKVEVLSGSSGTVLATIFGKAASRFGYSLATLRDVDQDGVEDFAVGIPLDDRGAINSGRVEVRSGATRALLIGHDSKVNSDQLGVSLASAGDVNGDGQEDLVVGARAPVRGVGGGLVRVLSGDGLVRLWDFHAEDPQEGLGLAVAGGADFDRDGLDDLLLGAPGFTGVAGFARAHSGSHLFLQVAPTTLMEGDSYEIGVRQGVAGRPAALFTVSINQVPILFRLLKQTLGSDGIWTVIGTVPAGLAGLQMEWVAVTLAASGKLVLSNLVEVELQ